MDELWIAVCDDLEEERRSLARMIHSYAQRRNRTVRFRFYSSGEELLASGQQVAACQILFLDIYMPGLSGVEAARRLRAAGCGTAIVFATTSLDHGLESFDVWAADYLTKPFRQEDIDRALDWCLEHLPEPMQVLPVYTEGETQELPLASVCYSLLRATTHARLRSRGIDYRTLFPGSGRPGPAPAAQQEEKK